MPLHLGAAEFHFATTFGLRDDATADFESVRMELRIAQPGSWPCMSADEFVTRRRPGSLGG